jgi:hypothetical protein
VPNADAASAATLAFDEEEVEVTIALRRYITLRAPDAHYSMAANSNSPSALQVREIVQDSEAMKFLPAEKTSPTTSGRLLRSKEGEVFTVRLPALTPTFQPTAAQLQSSNEVVPVSWKYRLLVKVTLLPAEPGFSSTDSDSEAEPEPQVQQNSTAAVDEEDRTDTVESHRESTRRELYLELPITLSVVGQTSLTKESTLLSRLQEFVEPQLSATEKKLATNGKEGDGDDATVASEDEDEYDAFEQGEGGLTSLADNDLRLKWAERVNLARLLAETALPYPIVSRPVSLPDFSLPDPSTSDSTVTLLNQKERLFRPFVYVLPVLPPAQ